MKKINLDEVYVLNSPKKAIMSFVVVNNKFPLSEPEHDRLYKLSCISDIFFIFINGCNINPEKFSSLYSGCCYIMSSENLTRSLLRAEEYSYEIFNTDGFSHVGYIITTVDLLPEINGEKIVSITSGITTSPIYKSRRLKSEEMYEIYSKKPGFLQREDYDRMYTIWTSESNMIFLRERHLRLMVGLSNKYIDSFSWNDPRYFTASSLKYLGISNIEEDILNLDVNDTTGKE